MGVELLPVVTFVGAEVGLFCASAPTAEAVAVDAEGVLRLRDAPERSGAAVPVGTIGILSC